MNSKKIKHMLFVLSFFIAGSLVAQQKLTKVSQSIDVNKDVTIDLNTSYCNIVFDTWNKNTVEIEAYIEGEKLSKEELQKALENWKVDVGATLSEVVITTSGSSPSTWAYRVAGDHDDVNIILEELKLELADAPEIHFGYNLEIPDVPVPPIPELPELPEGIHNMQFDYEAYKKDGDKYMEKWTKQFDKGFGKEYAEKMKAWSKKFTEEWEGKYAKQHEEWGKRFADQREAMQEQREAHREHIIVIREELREEREKMAEERKKLADERRVIVKKMVNKETSNSNVKKTIKIKMPKGAKLKLNVKHGELELASAIDNLKADLAYTKLIANSINGSKTSVNASYSPIQVSNWNMGELTLNFVKDAELKNVKRLVLTSSSSNLIIDNLIDNAIIDGNIGDLKILKIDDAFSNLNVILQNSNATISLPKVDYNFQYKGTRSRLKHPKKTSKDDVSNFTTNNPETNKTIVVNAKYSTVNME
ncbi:hypothetical protein KO566_04805 [Flavobacteriaceae bacterium XHP0103]|uniref:hypothetical protein n=1 Tax=Marixanthotalea marina TaxID=2844359 RepID=UPI002989AB33|nr:hypothetical protein [Marixanthotalea marina]MBU3821371.1 hypothetical protein [Marixanthotalea marina]